MTVVFSQSPFWFEQTAKTACTQCKINKLFKAYVVILKEIDKNNKFLKIN